MIPANKPLLKKNDEVMIPILKLYQTL